ncbi:MAG: FAD-dependent monooxygenase [Aestuariivirga sp.]|uniref:FAD-dependent monooxygenase n=1 Tax=Aestuariivirga sp. TaxID=2650926 RepID=UPI0025C1B9BC|nr:FAD-dependent monooxygenase [Aestuariivirga sp.]MCA3561709.1 FAD-dependent monooxygenase [Aestuariivirga sp.]
MSKSPDVIVIGAALNGLAAALALGGTQVKRPLYVVVVDLKDPRSFSTNAFDGRASAITAAARRMFESLGIWDKVAHHAQPMAEIIVTDSAIPGGARPVLLQFGEADMKGGPSAHMIENRFLYGAMLEDAQKSPHIRFCVGQAVEHYHFKPGLAAVKLADSTVLKAPLIAAADGRNSPAREAAGIKLIGWPYDQMGLVATVEHELPHNGRAEEHFTPSGPFAILPLPGNRSSLVWSERTESAQRMLKLPMKEFEDELKLRFGNHLGEVRLISGRHGYPLAMYLAETFTGPRLALAGDAAHVLHPLAGLGFNLGLRDVAALADCIHDAAALGLDIGSEPVLDRYTQWRRFDTVATGAMMDGMNRLFANTNPVLTLLRRAGLMTVNRMGGMKSMFVSEAAGISGDLPRLLRGEKV